MEAVTDFIFLGSKITEDGDYIHEIRRHLLLERKVMMNLESILKSERPFQILGCNSKRQDKENRLTCALLCFHSSWSPICLLSDSNSLPRCPQLRLKSLFGSVPVTQSILTEQIKCFQEQRLCVTSGMYSQTISQILQETNIHPETLSPVPGSRNSGIQVSWVRISAPPATTCEILDKAS